MQWFHNLSHSARPLLTGLLALILGACNSNGPGLVSGASETAVFEAGEAISLSEKDRDGVIVAHQLQLDRDRLLAATGAERIERFIRLPDGRALAYELQETQGNPPHTWRGRLYEGEQARSSLTLSRSGDRLTGGFRLEQQQYRIRSLDDGRLALLKLEDREPPPHLPPRVPEETDHKHGTDR